MKFQKIFTITVLALSATLIVSNIGCRSIDEEKAENGTVVVEKFSLDPYRQIITSQNYAELMPLIDAAIVKHADEDLATLKKLIAEEKLIADKYADLDARFKENKFYSQSATVFDDALAAASEESLVAAILLKSNPLLTQADLNAALADKDLVALIVSLVNSDNADDAFAKAIDYKPSLLISIGKVLASKDQNTAAAELNKNSDLLNLIQVASTYKLPNRNYLKEASELSDIALFFYGSRRYNSLDDNDLAARVKENIAAEVNTLYILTAEKQKTLNMALLLLEDCRSRYNLIEELKKSRSITPFRAAVEMARYAEMEELVKKLAYEFKVSSLLLSQYTGINGENGEYLLVDESILSSWFATDKEVTELGSRSSLSRTLSYNDFEKLASLSRRELAFFNRVNLLNVRDFADVVSQANQKPYYYIQSIRDLVKFRDNPSRYNLYFYPEKMEFEKRSPMLINTLASVKSAYNEVSKSDSAYTIALNNLRNKEKAFVNKLAQLNALDKNSSIGHLAKIDRKAISDLTSLELDAMRFELTKQEITAMERLSKSYDAWVMLLNAAGDSDITAMPIKNAVKNLRNTLNNAGKEFQKDSAEAPLKEVSPDVIPTVRFIDVDYIDSYQK